MNSNLEFRLFGLFCATQQHTFSTYRLVQVTTIVENYLVEKYYSKILPFSLFLKVRLSGLNLCANKSSLTLIRQYILKNIYLTGISIQYIEKIIVGYN